ncbi:MAG TPA: M56 family metallopeptidase [Puia sp.]|nr:M56 family metallopeptidase [Puia sp.]
MTWIPDTILRAVCWALLHSLWQGLVFALLAGLVLVLTKKASSALRYNLLCGGLALFLAVSGYTFYIQLHGADGAVVMGTPVHGTVGTRVDGVAAATGTNAPAFIDSLVQYFNTHAALVVVVWFIIFLARFVRLLSGLVYAQRIRYYQTNPAPAEWQQRLNELLRKIQVSRPVALLESALIKVPVVVGFLKPVVLVPIGMLAHLPGDQVESILLHELAHIRRRDHLFNLVQHLVDTLFFFNPAIVWVSSLIRAERENCCDDIAIRETRSRRQLIEALVSFHEYRQAVPGYALGFANEKESPVVKRVKRIVHKTNHSLNAGERVVLMSGLLVLSAAFVTINGSQRARLQKKAVVVTRVSPDPMPGAEATLLPERRQIRPNGDTTVRPEKKPATASATRPEPQQPAHAAAATADTNGGLNYLGYRNLSLDKLIQLKEHGVTAEYIQSFRQMGYPELSPDQAIELHDHGVTVEFIREIQEMGYKISSLRQARELVDHGVNVEYIRSLKDMGFTGIGLEEATRARDHGVTGDYIAACKKRFGKLFELKDYIKLRDAGINPEE